MAQHYIGVYATNERVPALGDFLRPLGTRKRLWFAWEMPEGKYTVQALNAAHQPMAEPRIVTANEFSSRFTYQADCFFAPEGYIHPSLQGVNAASSPLPNLFFDEKGSAVLPLPAPADTGGLLADDPNLLMHWAKVERRPKLKAVEPVKIPFDRLVGEVDTVGGAESGSPSIEEAAISPRSEDEAQQVRQLRSRFVQALLLLRRGARSESLGLLEEMLRAPYDPFEGGAQLFSEFGLGLRRLGFASLALAAHTRALEFAPEDPRVLFNMARSCHDLGLLVEARDYLEQALKAAPDFAAARQFLTFLDDADTAAGKE
ncbi:MAG: tetratricopeptide repeat protein [Deltaproteobacteria bacterium]|nr:tetratricopeptide repeat protein [Deltaproteobacteria bacterium]